MSCRDIPKALLIFQLLLIVFIEKFLEQVARVEASEERDISQSDAEESTEYLRLV